MVRLIILLGFLISCSLCWALGCAIAARTRNNVLRFFFRLGWGLLLILPWALACGVCSRMYYGVPATVKYLIICCVFTGAFIAIITTVSIRGWKKNALLQTHYSATWKKGKLFKYWLIMILLTLITYWNCDLSVHQAKTFGQLQSRIIAQSLIPAKIPDSENAAVQYNIGLRMLNLKNRPTEPDNKTWDYFVYNWRNPENGPFDPNNKQMLDFLSKNSDAIDHICKAASMKSVYWHDCIDVLVDNKQTSVMGDMKRSARLLSLSTRVSTANNQYADAAKNISCISGISETISNYQLLISILVSSAIDHIAFDDLQALLDQCPVIKPELSELQIDSCFSFDTAFHLSIQMEAACGQIYIITPEWFIENPVEAAFFKSSPYNVFFWQDDFAAYKTYMGDLVNYSKQPYYQSGESWKKANHDRNNLSGCLAFSFTPALGKAAVLATDAQIRRDLMVFVDKINKFALAEGRLPEGLDELSPKYIPILPRDPYTGESYKVLQDDDTLTIYSVGEDLIDGKAAEWNAKKRTGDISIRMRKR